MFFPRTFISHNIKLSDQLNDESDRYATGLLRLQLLKQFNLRFQMHIIIWYYIRSFVFFRNRGFSVLYPVFVIKKLSVLFISKIHSAIVDIYK